ncbi:hypothetical protein [Sphingomonas yabuuchiae]|uniref:hypothetical protein n=1 Tax=Sphingomonas yabuuchiae TaxID=172044 RepID=UPI003D983396
MIDGGAILIVVGWLMMCAAPAEKMVAGRRAARPVVIGVVLRTAYPPPACSPSLIELVAAADAALENDALMLGERGVSDVYDQA